MRTVQLQRNMVGSLGHLRAVFVAGIGVRNLPLVLNHDMFRLHGFPVKAFLDLFDGKRFRADRIGLDGLVKRQDCLSNAGTPVEALYNSRLCAGYRNRLRRGSVSAIVCGLTALRAARGQIQRRAQRQQTRSQFFHAFSPSVDRFSWNNFKKLSRVSFVMVSSEIPSPRR